MPTQPSTERSLALAYPPSGPSPEEPSDLSICIFPHLTEFLVIDASQGNPDAPRLHLLTTGQVLNELFYEEVEKDFRESLRKPDQPLPYLMALPQQLEAILRYKALKAIIRVVDDTLALKTPERVAILFCSGDVLTATTSQIEQLLQDLAGGETDSLLISQWASRFEELQGRELLEVRREVNERRREAVQPSEGDFFTLWENPR